MTDPIDETQPHPTDLPTAGDATTAGGSAPGSTTAGDSTTAAPDGGSTTAAPDGGSPGPADPTLAADPDRPADSGWREPPWFPPRHRDRRPSLFAVIVGLVLIAVGAYYFLDRTLGITMPRIQWSTIWPIVLIVVGAVVLLRSFQRKA